MEKINQKSFQQIAFLAKATRTAIDAVSDSASPEGKWLLERATKSVLEIEIICGQAAQANGRRRVITFNEIAEWTKRIIELINLLAKLRG